jgi:hypothetical protein
MSEGVRDEQRKGRKLSLDEINHYMKMEKAIRLTMELQEKVDYIYGRRNSCSSWRNRRSPPTVWAFVWMG